jgi:hypothetical protein
VAAWCGMFAQNREFEQRSAQLEKVPAEWPKRQSTEIIRGSDARVRAEPATVMGTSTRAVAPLGSNNCHRLRTPQQRQDLAELNCNVFGDPRMQCTSPNLGQAAARRRKGPSANPLSAVQRSSSRASSDGTRSRSAPLDNRQRRNLVRGKANKDRSLAEWEPETRAINQRSFATGTAMKPKGELAFSGTANLAATGWLQRAGGAKQARHGKFCPLDGGTMARPQDQRLSTSSIAAIPREKGPSKHGRWTPNEKYHGRKTNFDWLGVERGPVADAKPSNDRVNGRPKVASETWEHHMFESAAAQPRDVPSLYSHHGGDPTYHFRRSASDVTRLGTL